ncbi:MAG TPA: C39 family peptidase [Patescibacteria group bacterium]|nr:C39 family peptidase [Patescibacteria group bacterium]
MPYTPQAPYGYWQQPWKDACEEASIAMVEAFYLPLPTASLSGRLERTLAKKRIQYILDIKNQFYGPSLDENATLMADLINKYLAFEATIVDNPSQEQIKNELDHNRPVIVPLSGPDLKNPYFRYPPPRYHVLVITGYDEEKTEYITNEPGLNSGLDFRYHYDRISSALHDYVPTGDIKNGLPRAIFTSAQIISSADTDGDNDGLTKAEEISYQTSLLDTDTDDDNFLDGQEVADGYDPLTNETQIKDQDLVKLKDEARVYLIEKNVIRHILNEEVFNRHNFSWSSIKTVGPSYFSRLKIGLSLIE